MLFFVIKRFFFNLPVPSNPLCRLNKLRQIRYVMKRWTHSTHLAYRVSVKLAQIPFRFWWYSCTQFFRWRLNVLKMLREVDPSKYHGVGYFLPFIRPSILSVILVFVCGILFIKNEETNDRLFALEQQMAVFTEECYVMRLNARREEIPPTVHNGESVRSRPISSMTENLTSSLSGRLNLVLKLQLF